MGRHGPVDLFRPLIHSDVEGGELYVGGGWMSEMTLREAIWYLAPSERE